MSAAASPVIDTVCADTILIDDLPAELVKKLRLPHYQTVPATLIGRLARDLTFKGKGLGELLLSNALRLAWDTSQAVASWAVTVDAKDEKARKAYEDFGFISFADTAKRLYMPMKTIDRADRSIGATHGVDRAKAYESLNDHFAGPEPGK